MSALRRIAVAALALCALAAQAAPAAGPQGGPQGLDELLRQIREGAAANAKIDAEREQRFIKNRADQQAELAKAEGEMKAAQARADAIRARFEANQKAIAELKAQSTAQSGDLGQVYTAAREEATQFRAAAVDSFVTSQYPERMKLLDALADASHLPSGKQLEDYWYVLQQELIENGRVARYSTDVVGADGVKAKAEVVRFGAFGAVSDGHYLVMQNGALTVPERQTQAAGPARALAEAKPGDWSPIAIDATRGGLLRLASLRPTIVERIEQGGSVGYVIILLGLVGVGLALYQFWYLAVVGTRMQRQLASIEAPNPDNPLGRVLSCLRDEAAVQDPEVLETRLNEAVLRELPRIERFQPFLRMVVAAGPLLGLVGTVTGMIITFQVITEVGAGDPKVMAGGISQAMIATVLGLMIAIPILFINSVLGARSRILVQILDEQSAGLLARRLEARGGGG